jgi:hypothetical protein
MLFEIWEITICNTIVKEKALKRVKIAPGLKKLGFW